MRVVYRAIKFVEYLLRAKSKYYLHSPFVYQFYLQVLEGDCNKQIDSITTLRKTLRANTTKLLLNDFGTGKATEKTISCIEQNVSIRPKYGLLLFRLVQHFKPRYILEIGTSIGISSSYMALAAPHATVFSLEGSPALIQVAKQNYNKLKLSNVHLKEGDFDKTITKILPQMPVLDLVFFDGNHTQQATIKYFEECMQYAGEQSVFVFDDIYWSREMTAAWEIIRQHPAVTLTIDVYQFGICFFRKDKLAKEHFVLWY